MIDVVEQVIERHPEVKNEGIPEGHTKYPKAITEELGTNVDHRTSH